VLGHIGFAANMAGTYGVGSIGKDMALEVVAYMKALQGDTQALSEVLSSYDSSADYWKVIKDKDGKVAKVIDDGDYENLNIYGADGKFEKQVSYTKGTSLVNAILNAAEGMQAETRGQANWDRVNQVLIASGLDYEAGGRGWYAKSEAAKAERAKAIAERNTPTSTEIQKPGFLQQVTGFFSDFFSGKGIFKEAQQANMTANKTMLDMMGGLFQKPKLEETREQRQPLTKDNSEYRAVNDKLKMQDYDPDKTISLGGSEYTLGGQGCRLLAVYRILHAAGVDTTPTLLASDRSNFFNDFGDFNDRSVFDKNGLDLEGPITSIEERLKSYVADGSQGWLYATVLFGDGTHTINLKNVILDAAGRISFEKQGTSKNDRNREFGVYNSNKPDYYQLYQLYIVRRKK